MQISKVTIQNYKLLKGEHSFVFGPGLNFLVGENNTGKSTVFDAINFVRSAWPKDKEISDVKNKFAQTEDPVSCTIRLEGNIKDVISQFSEKKYEKFVFEEDSKETLLIQRSSETKTISQSGKSVNLDIKKVTIWNPESQQFENPSGLDSVLSTLFEAQFVWADTDPKEISDFGSTKICGRLLNEAVGDFFEGDLWKKFTDVHQQTFHGEGDSLGKRAEKIETQIKEVLQSQYGVADIKFDFSLPETATFYKTAEIIVNDGAHTKLEDKGTGMQRAIALAIIQVYSQSLAAHPEDPTKSRPLFFFIDEPEICLHPKAQHQLLDALIEIAKVRQIFISTHSPYLLKKFNPAVHSLFIFSKDGGDVKVTETSELKLFSWSPSLGEINYRAYQICTVEFHNELYGHIQEREQKFTEKDMESFLTSKGKLTNKTWVKVKNGQSQPGYSVTLMTFIRNTIHHPENRSNADFTEQELRNSIQEMISLS
jgi:predicted ATPase